MNIADAVEYQKQAVVSKMIINKKSGTVTVFAFDKGEGLSEHIAPYDALIHIIDGEAEITISGVKHSLKSEEYIILPAKQPHSVKALAKFKMILTMIRSE